MRMSIYIAKSKRVLAHYFLRVFDIDAAKRMGKEDLAPFINGIVTAKGHKQFASAVDFAPRLLFDTEGTPKQPKRMATPRECLEMLNSEFEPTNARVLAREMFLASPRRIRANRSSESPAAVLDAYACDFASELEKMGEGVAIAVEPIQDWITFRAFLMLGATLLANIENPPVDGRVMEASGFARQEESRFGCPAFAMPFKFQAATFLPDFFRHPMKSSGLTRLDVDYLYWLYNGGVEAAMNRRPESNGAANLFDPSNGVHLVSRFDGGSDSDPAFDRESIRNVYLCVEEREGESQIEVAKMLFKSLWRKTQQLVDGDATPLGMSLDEGTLFSGGKEAIGFTFHSLISECWYDLTYHKGKRLFACKYCGCGAIASNRGPAREFCSDACRMQYAEKQNG